MLRCIAFYIMKVKQSSATLRNFKRRLQLGVLLWRQPRLRSPRHCSSELRPGRLSAASASLPAYCIATADQVLSYISVDS